MANAKHLFVNLTTCEYISPVAFAEPDTARSIVNNHSGVMYALALLITTPLNDTVSTNSHTGQDFIDVGLRINNNSNVRHFIGSWYGGSVVMASSDEKVSPLLTPYYMKNFPVKRYSRWTVYRLAEQFFEDVSLPMIETIKVIEKDFGSHPVHSIRENGVRNHTATFGSAFTAANDVVVDVSIPVLIDPNNPNRRKYMA